MVHVLIFEQQNPGSQTIARSEWKTGTAQAVLDSGLALDIDHRQEALGELPPIALKDPNSREANTRRRNDDLASYARKYPNRRKEKYRIASFSDRTGTESPISIVQHISVTESLENFRASLLHVAYPTLQVPVTMS